MIPATSWKKQNRKGFIENPWNTRLIVPHRKKPEKNQTEFTVNRFLLSDSSTNVIINSTSKSSATNLKLKFYTSLTSFLTANPIETDTQGKVCTKLVVPSIGSEENKQINQSINQSITRLLDYSIDRSINQSIDRSPYAIPANVNQSSNQAHTMTILQAWEKSHRLSTLVHP